MQFDFVEMILTETKNGSIHKQYLFSSIHVLIVLTCSEFTLLWGGKQVFYVVHNSGKDLEAKLRFKILFLD